MPRLMLDYYKDLYQKQIKLEIKKTETQKTKDFNFVQ